jgi:adenosine/AMP kinase
MKPNQRAVEASNDSLYWWDGYRKEIVGYTDGYNINLLQRIKNVANYIHSGEESTTPSVIYDTDNKEVLFNVVND